ncbi:hypothetical protein WK09_28145 [Burkholderia ubonensis]|nr:hypothetical protein WK09_28145 [Burkholderia ubonensis]KWB97445.1 hypothetical protein WL43_30085 [Burkholderia ubonensis]
MRFLFPLDDECPEGLRSAFFKSLRDPLVRRLADEVPLTAAQLSTDFGRLAETRQAVLAAEATGTSVVDILRARIDDLRSQRAGMKQSTADVDRFVAEQRARFRAENGRCAAMLLDGPQKIEALRAKVRGYSPARDAMAARLREAGLDDGEIQRVGVKPTPDDLAAWKAEIEDIEHDIHLAQQFIASAPLFDVALLAEMRHG